MVPQYEDRRQAGVALARLLAGRRFVDPIVLALPRGGVPVAREVAAALQAPMDVFVVRKLGVPGRPELAMGAIASGGTMVLNNEVLGPLRIDPGTIREVARREAEELARRERAYRGDRPAPAVGGRDVILVDDGLATGSTMRAAVAALKTASPARIVVAVPVGHGPTCEQLRSDVDDLVCALTPRSFWAVGESYRDFSPVTDAQVRLATMD